MILVSFGHSIGFIKTNSILWELSESKKVVTLDHFPFLYLWRSAEIFTFEVIFLYPSTETVMVTCSFESIIKFVATRAVCFILGTMIGVYIDISVGALEYVGA